MTKQDVIDYITAQLQTPVTLVSKILNSFLKLLDFASQSTVSDVIPDWTAAITFQTDGSDGGKYCLHPDTNGKKRIFETKVDDNLNNEPPTDPGVTENASWVEISQSAGSGINEWSAGVYGSGLVIVYHNHSVNGGGLYKLLAASRPYASTDIEAEITAGDWERITGNTVTLASGTYTPTVTNVSNLSANVPYECQYMRVGNVVTVSGRIDTTESGTGVTGLRMSLPIASDFASSPQCGGTAYSNASEKVAQIIPDTVNNEAFLKYNVTSPSAREFWFSFTYLIV